MSDATRSRDAPEGADDADVQAAGRDAEAREAERESEARAEEDAEEVGSEWHVWLFAVLVVGGIVLFFAPRGFLPELLANLGALLVVVGVFGWVVKWAIGRSG